MAMPIVVLSARGLVARLPGVVARPTGYYAWRRHARRCGLPSVITPGGRGPPIVVRRDLPIAVARPVSLPNQRRDPPPGSLRPVSLSTRPPIAQRAASPPTQRRSPPSRIV
ncbi:hypothetical protein H696_06137 [Fonticula alba]|uniref:Uncharacterized protein n=1 Tax=Fonticula alba TaxID=691883 RepID=A0A058Z1R1_FONAL|nr:hypothetical protein H696_06137 [Fonticula alba]KCV67442.1 hypothetical protein H696_06137 [Fonticula alba]|eukprot:XP_009498169.1 hypothetical protein H696_06137 [Fonticula alba]